MEEVNSRLYSHPFQCVVLSCTRTQTRPRTQSQADSSLPTIRSIPNHVLANDVLGYLTDKTVKKFLDALGVKEQRQMRSESALYSSSLSELGERFCTKHGSRLENPLGFSSVADDAKPDTTDAKPSTLCCPECYAEEQNMKRCNGCRIFYPRYNNPEDDKPGLSCQRCDRMAFCNACLSNDLDGCGSAGVATQSFNFGAFGRKLSNSNNTRRYCNTGRITCQNFCCPNIFTNTMCGEFVCDDCGEDHLRRLQNMKSQTKQAAPAADSKPTSRNDSGDHREDTHLQISSMGIQTCDECGKATCLDPNCMVCSDFRLVHTIVTSNGSWDDAYRLPDLGDLFFGHSGGNRNTCRADSHTKLRRNISDVVVWAVVGWSLCKMWWH